MTSYKKVPYLELALASWCQQDHAEFEIVLCDDGTPGGLRHVVDRFRDVLDITLVEQMNTGRAAARNRALRSVAGDVVIFSDDDRMVRPDFVSQHLRARTGSDLVVLGYKHELVSVVEPGLDLSERLPDDVAVDSDGRTFSAADVRERVDEVLRTHDLGPGYDNADDVLAAFGDELDGFRLPWALATTANMSVSRDLLAAAGGFDEQFAGWGGEDTELAFRLVQAGARVVMARQALNFHQIHPRKGNPTIAVAGQERTELLGNLRYFASLHPCIETHLFYRAWLRRTSLVTASRMVDLVLGADEAVLGEFAQLLAEQVPVGGTRRPTFDVTSGRGSRG